MRETHGLSAVIRAEARRVQARAGCGFLPMLRRLVPEDPEGIAVTIRDASETRPASSPSATLFSFCYALSPSAVRGKGAQPRVKGRSRRFGAPPAGPGAAEQEPHGATGTTTPRDSPAMVRAGLLGRSGAGACPNLLQRRPGPGSASRKSAEYRRFSSHAPARSGPSQQIRTIGAARGPLQGRPPLGRRP